MELKPGRKGRAETTVTPDNTAELVRAGADVLVSGSAFFSVPPYESRRRTFEARADEALSQTL